MVTAEMLNTPAYDAFEAGTVELHRLIREGQDDSDAANDLRDWLDGPWAGMTPEQRRFGKGLSADLYMLNPDDGEVFRKATDEERSPQRLGLAILAARDRRDWAAMLELLRKGPLGVPADSLAFMRARAYGELGRTTVAVAFARHAYRLNPAEGGHRQLEVDLLNRGGRATDAAAVTRTWIADETVPAGLRILAAAQGFAETRGQDGRAARPILEMLAGVVRTSLAAISAGPDEADTAEFIAYGHLVLGGCLDRLGDLAGARAEFDTVLQVPPRTWEDRVTRAALREYVDRQATNVTAESNSQSAPTGLLSAEISSPSSESDLPSAVLYTIVSQAAPRKAA